jgi:hypothetical protein
MPPSSKPTDAPPAHEGAHYDNPASKPIVSPARKGDREGVQRLVWALFFVLILGVVATGVVLGVSQSPP